MSDEHDWVGVHLEGKRGEGGATDNPISILKCFRLRSQFF